MNKTVVALVCGFACTAFAQIGDYLGPGVMSTGAGTIGMRSGQQVDLRFYANVEGVYDNGLLPFVTNSQGQLVSINGLYGEQVDVGAYGQHSWKQALLGLDFRGDYYHYDNASNYDGNGEFLNLGYTYQKSRRLIFNFRGTGGSTSVGYGSPGYYEVNTATNVVGQQSAVLFDNRFYYLQGGADVTYILTPRTSFSAGADGFASRYQAASLIGVDGYSAHGSIQHRLSRTKTLGVTYGRMQYDFVKSYGQASTNTGQIFFASALGQRWAFNISAGIAQSNVQGVQQISLSPVIAALLGQSYGTQTFHASDFYPSGTATLTGKLKNSVVTMSYGKTIVPGNGVYLTSREDVATGNYSYTGIHKWNFGLTGAYFRLNSLGQTIQSYSTFGAGTGLTYSLTRSFHLLARYDYRRQDISEAGFRRDASRITAGIGWSPGDLPLSLW